MNTPEMESDGKSTYIRRKWLGVVYIPLLAFPIIMVVFLLEQSCGQGNKWFVKSKVPIDGLFGLKLGEPLPASVKNAAGNPLTSADFGPIEKQCDFIVFEPPNPNPAFGLAFVTLTATNRLVCQISAYGKSSIIGDVSAHDVAIKLARKYGKPSDLRFSRWFDGRHTLEFVNFEANDYFHITCTDDELYQRPSSTPLAPIDELGL